jgi:hypothetical protein
LPLAEAGELTAQQQALAAQLHAFAVPWAERAGFAGTFDCRDLERDEAADRSRALMEEGVVEKVIDILPGKLACCPGSCCRLLAA